MPCFSLRRCVYAVAVVFVAAAPLRAQRFLTDIVDTSTEVGKGLLSIYQNYNSLRVSAYMQPQWQWVSAKGADGYFGGNFPQEANNRFRLRRGRVRFDYIRRNVENKPVVQFALQFDGTEQGVNIRDMWGRLLEQRLGVASLTAGMFGRPFGFEVSLSSIDREAPERGRASQILMRTERDLGAMVTLQPTGTFLQNLSWLRIDAGLFNGQGLAGPAEYDSRKDFIGRIAIRPPSERNRPKLTGSLSYFNGGIVNTGSILYQVGTGAGGEVRQLRDSGAVGRVAPRKYFGADAQFRVQNRRRGFTEFRAEYWRGTQTATAGSSETPGTLPQAASGFGPLYVRPFDAAFFHVLQHLGSDKHQLVVKYDWYDPNTRVEKAEISPVNGFSAADVRYNTLGGGYVWYINPNAKATLWYEHIMNEKTAVDGYREDLSDDAVTIRLQFRF